MTPRVALFTGIYPPDTGGPAKFAETFASFLTEHHEDVMVMPTLEILTKIQYIKDKTLD